MAGGRRRTIGHIGVNDLVVLKYPAVVWERVNQIRIECMVMHDSEGTPKVDALYSSAEVGQELLVALGLAQTLQKLLCAFSVQFLVTRDHVDHAA